LSNPWAPSPGGGGGKKTTPKTAPLRIRAKKKDVFDLTWSLNASDVPRGAAGSQQLQEGRCGEKIQRHSPSGPKHGHKERPDMLRRFIESDGGLQSKKQVKASFWKDLYETIGSHGRGIVRGKGSVARAPPKKKRSRIGHSRARIQKEEPRSRTGSSPRWGANSEPMGQMGVTLA